MRLEREALPAGQLVDFRRRLNLRAKYRIASRLWASHGFTWQRAMELAEDAFAG